MVDAFEAERPRLRGIAYRLLGTPDDADDVVQDAWLRYSAVDQGSIDNPAAWLTTVTTRLAIDRLRATKRQREAYVGPWLPCPIASEPAVEGGPDDAVLLAESLSLGFLAVLERLSPLERAVFILHEVFAYPLAEVAEIIERNHAATRQLAKRARDHMKDGRPRFAADPTDVETLTELMMAATLAGDIETLTSFLAEDAVHISDGGADHRAARVPVVGPHRIARFYVNLAKRWEPTMAAHVVRANGQLGIYLTDAGEPFMLMVNSWVDGKVTGSYAVRNPDKLAAFHAHWKASQTESLNGI